MLVSSSPSSVTPRGFNWDTSSLERRLAETNYQGYMLVEQDVLPGMGSPKESARRNRQYLASIEHHFAYD